MEAGVQGWWGGVWQQLPVSPGYEEATGHFLYNLRNKEGGASHLGAIPTGPSELLDVHRLPCLPGTQYRGPRFRPEDCPDSLCA